MKGISTMKRIFKLVISLLLIIFVFIILPLILFNKKLTPPINQYVSSSETEFYQSLNQELESLITDSNEDNIILTFSEAFINRAIQKELSKSNPHYMNNDYLDEISHDYMTMFGRNFGFKGVWTKLSDDKIIIYAGADYAASPGKVLYQTGIEIIFDIVLSENNEYYLKLSKLEIGKIKLPLKSAYNFASFIIKQLSSRSLTDIIAENLSFGEFNESDFSFSIGEAELANYLYDLDPTFAALLKVIYKEDLLILDVSEQGFDISLNVGVFRRLTSDLEEPAFTRWESSLDKAAFMANLASQAIVNAMLNPLDPRIDLNETDLNAILDYTLEEKVKFEFPIKYKLNDEEIEYLFTSTNLFVRMNDDVLSIHLKMTLSKTGMSGTFDMQFNLTSRVSMNENGDMILTIINANIGEVELDTDILTVLFSVFDDQLMNGNTLVIKKETLNKMFEGSDIVFNDSYVINSNLRMHFGLDN